ncbi:hypothetical protein LXL04_009795 [Taraxacum kok-saghyz]
MAVQVCSSRPLDPKASPYHKMPTTNLCIYAPPPSPAYYHILPPVISLYRFYSYNVHFQPAPVKSLPLSFRPPPSPEKKTKLSLGPVPSGPRVTKSRLPVYRRRKANNAVRVAKSCDGGNEQKAQRWKNRSGGYQQILPLDKKTTTVMIKNIPNKYTRKLMIQTLDNHCKAENKTIKNFVTAYDFLYLPIDFNRRVNAGFAFVNFTTPESAARFKEAFHCKRWDFFDSPKIAEITRARIQGKRFLINNCKTMDFTYGSEEDMPVSFQPARDGSDRVRPKMTVLGKFIL